MPTSAFDALMSTVAIPAIMDVFAVDVTHTNSDGDETPIVVIFETAVAPVGEFGERMEPRTTATLAKSLAAAVGDTLTYAGEVTADDPVPDDVVWLLTQVLNDDGYLTQFALRRVIE